jgi:DNA-binding CsgD family transcriptional regulator
MSVTTTELVGRDAELGTVRDALTAMPATAGVVLEGEAGIGKTAVWRAGVAEAERRGLQVMGARPAESESAFSHAALGDLLGPLADDLEGALPGPQRHALDVALLRARADSSPVDPVAVGAATLTLLRTASDRAPLVVAIDDVQWLDPASVAAIRFALRRLGDAPVVLLATRRPEPEAKPIDIGIPEEMLARVKVGPLDRDELGRVLQQQIGEPIPRPALARLAAVSGGNPYYALELARAAMRQSGGAPLSAELPLPEGIYAVLHDRLRAFSRETGEALAAVAAMGHPTTAAAVDAVDARALDAAFAAGVLHEQRDRIHFDHPLLAEAAYRLVPPSRRRAVHRRLASLATDVEERARHLAAASTTPDANVAADIAAGAEVAAARGAPAAAAELLEASAGVEPDAELAARRRIDAVRYHVVAGDGRRSIALSRALIDELSPGPLRARALVAATEQEGPVERTLALARQAAAEAGDDWDVEVEALLAESLGLCLADRYDDALAVLIRANELCGPSSERTLRIKVTSAYGRVLLLRGEEGAIELLREAAELEGDDLIPSAYWGPGTILGRALMYADELDAARPLLEERHRRAIEIGDDESRGGLCLHLAELEVLAGRLDEATRYAEEGLAIDEASYGDQAQGSLMYVRALAAAHIGDVGLAREVGQRSLRRCELQGDQSFALVARGTLGFLELSVGDYTAAAEWLWPVAERFRTSPAIDPGLPRAFPVPDAVEALTAVGRLDEAEAVLIVWEAVGERLRRARVRGSAARCRALIAAARGDLGSALAHAEAALEHQRDLGLPLERARTLIVLGSIQRRTKRKAAARASLEEALASLETMGARLWAERARAELARVGGRARSGGLTPTEERVAALVAEGRSNKEVAELLFVSVRTVEANLTRVYSKLGIRSRTELAASRPASGGRSRSPSQPRA